MRVPADWAVTAYTMMRGKIECCFRDPDFAHEVAADRLIEVLGNPGFEFSNEGSFYALCLKYVKQRAWDSLRRWGRHRPLNYEPAITCDLHWRLREEVFEAIKRLPAARRELVEQHYYEGMSMRQIAAHHTGCTETVRKKLRKVQLRALESLRANLQDCPAVQMS